MKEKELIRAIEVKLSKDDILTSQEYLGLRVIMGFID